MSSSDFDNIALYSFANVSTKLKCPPLPYFGNSRSVADFIKLNRIGEGTYGVVYRAKDTAEDNAIVALKRIRMEKDKEGLPICSMREINILRSLDHMNIVKLRDVVVGRPLEYVFLVMEYCEHDLANLMENMTTAFTEAQIKCLLLQLMTGVHYLHCNFIIHRDLKLSNLLLKNDGTLKIADFGLARNNGLPKQALTPVVVTLWYRCPELLLGSRFHTSAVDIWAAGCIMAELLLCKPIMPGNSEIHQMQLIIELLGSPNEKIWPSYVDLPFAEKFTFKHQPYNNIKQKFPWLSSVGILLLNNMFTFDPCKRITALDALNSAYFKEKPLPVNKSMIPSFPEHRNFKEVWDETEGGRGGKKYRDAAGGESSKKRGNTKVTDDLIERMKTKIKKK